MAKKQLVLVVLLVLGAVVAVAMGAWAIIDFHRWVRGRAADYAEMSRNPDLRRLARALPRGATSIRYVFQPGIGQGYAVFTLGEREFLDWAKAEGWVPSRIDGHRVVQMHGVFPSTNFPDIEEGYHVEESVGNDSTRAGPGLIVEYDARRSLVYYIHRKLR